MENGSPFDLINFFQDSTYTPELPLPCPLFLQSNHYPQGQKSGPLMHPQCQLVQLHL